ncbi:MULTISPECIES: hypothetical protein [unclassified Novosphingobium]|uniref:hypothetical protein n=1 Tax=unclassified Novosphingobium TaxID=2644732 RepID=UPI000EEF5713|nr:MULTISPECIES: hypothetical protein [unclassified Novosphingobium]HCF25107.1 hypothetical protein [Novosphingobium sp.]HQV02274.1 hypothetical protein [Novosphingobium sp.]
MLDLLAQTVLALVCLLLVWTLFRQFVVSSPAGMVLDQLAIAPQWKFFAQTRIDGHAEFFDDIHLLVRTSPEAGKPNDWVELLHYGERPLWHGIWNPRRYSRSLIVQHVMTLALAEDDPEQSARPSALCYLTVLRFALDRMMPGPGEALQFSVATTGGRIGREPKVRFLSAWHCP